jgi:uncharacterized protein YbcV (DUF1398 family)
MMGMLLITELKNIRSVLIKKYDKIKIAATANKERFIEFLVMHQDGQTDYFTFVNKQPNLESNRASTLSEMTCTYFDASANAIIIEKIPS